MKENLFSYAAARANAKLARRHYDVRIDTNNTCNLNCIYCQINDYTNSAEYMSVSSFNTLANIFFPESRYVSLSFGTEPLMSKHFSTFLEILHSYNVPDTHYITNGLLLDKNIIEQSILAKINAITISNPENSPIKKGKAPVVR